ncbi:hypothetical protein TCON_1270 [Astathelohania contejeani]|uniref:Uncharacterized protein n=1 Tax=Astathelohania contejeani TaxID=164912 RepID=A0ABQ7HZG0_9MICR|nr:hypothetical protein TCON_1270 [Thelohania contejeani]
MPLNLLLGFLLIDFLINASREHRYEIIYDKNEIKMFFESIDESYNIKLSSEVKGFDNVLLLKERLKSMNNIIDDISKENTISYYLVKIYEECDYDHLIVDQSSISIIDNLNNKAMFFENNSIQTIYIKIPDFKNQILFLLPVDINLINKENKYYLNISGVNIRKNKLNIEKLKIEYDKNISKNINFYSGIIYNDLRHGLEKIKKKDEFNDIISNVSLNSANWLTSEKIILGFNKNKYNIFLKETLQREVKKLLDYIIDNIFNEVKYIGDLNYLIMNAIKEYDEVDINIYELFDLCLTICYEPTIHNSGQWILMSSDLEDSLKERYQEKVDIKKIFVRLISEIITTKTSSIIKCLDTQPEELKIELLINKS